jgi:DNA-3-methyladenine glycosylase I
MEDREVVGDDGVARCPWGLSPPEYRKYHDEEWGRPVGEEDRIYEKLCLEGFQSGLSWLTILRKREAFREAFASFDPAVVATFNDDDVDRLLQDSSIVRHRGKIEATIANARGVLGLRSATTSLPALVWAHEVPPLEAPLTMSDLTSSTPGSKALSKQLLLHGFRFVGPTTVYAAMQSLGVVNDHLQGCHFRENALLERARFSPPT